MSTTLSFGPVSVSWPWNYQLVAVPNNISSQGPFQYTTTALANGTGAGQADVLYTNQFTIAASGTDTIDLAAATNAFGTSVSFARLKAMYFENVASSTGKSTGLAIGGAGTTPFTGGFFNAGTDTLTLRNGMHLSVGVCQDATGYPVSTGVNLLLTNSDSGNVSVVNVGLVGCSV